MTTDAERFWVKVQKSDGCWLWTGSQDGHGYGQLRRSNQGRGKTFKAHRYVLILGGVEVAGQDVDHICHTRLCVRPDHLRVVNRKQNLENHSGPRKDNKSGIRGVYWCNTFQKWYGSVCHLGKHHRKGFATKAEAADWVLSKRIELHTHNDADRVSA